MNLHKQREEEKREEVDGRKRGGGSVAMRGGRLIRPADALKPLGKGKGAFMRKLI